MDKRDEKEDEPDADTQADVTADKPEAPPLQGAAAALLNAVKPTVQPKEEVLKVDPSKELTKDTKAAKQAALQAKLKALQADIADAN
jgi:hypothetical protein